MKKAQNSLSSDLIVYVEICGWLKPVMLKYSDSKLKTPHWFFFYMIFLVPKNQCPKGDNVLLRTTFKRKHFGQWCGIINICWETKGSPLVWKQMFNSLSTIPLLIYWETLGCYAIFFLSSLEISNGFKLK
jgi:hypothetical protein